MEMTNSMNQEVRFMNADQKQTAAVGGSGLLCADQDRIQA